MTNQYFKKQIRDREKTEKQIRYLKNFHESIVQNMAEGIIVDDIEGRITFVNSALCDLLGYSEQELIGQKYPLYVPPDQLYIVQEADNRRAEGKADSYAIDMKRKDGRRVHVLVSGSPVFEGGKLNGTLAVFTDISKQKEAEREAQRRVVQASLIYETGQQLSKELDLNTLLSEIVSAVRDAFDYYGVMLLLYQPRIKKLVLQAIAGGYARVFPKKLSLKLGEGMIGTAAVTGKTQISNDVTCNPNYIQKANEITQSELCVPLKLGDQIIGVLDVQSDRVNAFQETDIAAIETLSTQIASAIRNARLYEKAQSELIHRKKIEKELKAKEITLRELFHNMSSGAAVFKVNKNDKDFLFVDINNAVERMEKVKKEDVLGQSILSIFTGKTGQDLIKIFRQVWNTGKAEKCSLSNYNKKILESYKEHYVYKLPSGEIVDIYNDSTKRKKAEQDIKANEKKYRKLFNGVADPVVIFDKKTHLFLDCNDAFHRIYEYTLDEIRSMTPFDLHPPEEAEKVKETIDVRNVDQPNTYTHVTRNGHKIIVEILSDEIIYEGRPAWISIIRDITERNRLEEQLKEFAYIVSHDLKAPLRGVSQLATWLYQDYAESVDEEGKEKFDLLLGRVKRMDNLINGILQYSRAGRVLQEIEEIDLNRIVPEIIRDLAPPKHMKVEVDNSLPRIIAEPVKMEQIFQNLISNAIKFNDKKKGEIRIGCDEESGYYKFHVSDNGPGIEERYFEKIFKIFQTLEARDKRESTGVGLSVVQKIVEQQGGKIWVESKVGEGSTFYFTLKMQGQHIPS
jgi:two-component system sensor kinase FixL